MNGIDVPQLLGYVRALLEALGIWNTVSAGLTVVIILAMAVYIIQSFRSK